MGRRGSKRRSGASASEPGVSARDTRSSGANEELHHESHGSREEGRSRRGSSDDHQGHDTRSRRHDATYYDSEEEEDAQDAKSAKKPTAEKIAPGGWASSATEHSGLFGGRGPISIRTDDSAESAEKRPGGHGGAGPVKKAKQTHGQKIAGVFGLSDSDDDKEATKRELMAAARSKKASASGIAAPQSRIATPGLPSTGAASADNQPSSSDVAMRLAKFKMTCKGKWVDMPEDLRRDVNRMMGTNR